MPDGSNSMDGYQPLISPTIRLLLEPMETMISILESALVANGVSYQGNSDRFPLEAKTNMLVLMPRRKSISGTKATGSSSLVMQSGPQSATMAPSGLSTETTKSTKDGVVIGSMSLALASKFM